MDGMDKATYLLVLLALVSPVDLDLGVEDLSAVEGLESGLSSSHVHAVEQNKNGSSSIVNTAGQERHVLLNETVVETPVLVVSVRDDLDVLDRSSDGKDLGEHVL